MQVTFITHIYIFHIIENGTTHNKFEYGHNEDSILLFMNTFLFL